MLYLDYFQELQKTLHEQGNGQPQLILDLSKLENRMLTGCSIRCRSI